MSITVIYYDTGTPKEEIQSAANTVAAVLEGHKVIAIPKQFDLLLNCSTDQLVVIRNIIDMALMEKLNVMNTATLPDIPAEEAETESNIIDISKYLS